MLNRPGFVSSKYRQPDEYRVIFEDWVAVFRIGGCEYHVQLEADWRNKKTARDVSILCQGKDCRNVLVSGIPSVKRAMERLEEIAGSNK